MCETFLRGDEILNVDGFRFYGLNRQMLHQNANRGSGGVGILVKNELLDYFDIKVVNNEIEGILWLESKFKFSSNNFCIVACYLPPSDTCKPVGSRDILPELTKSNILLPT